MENTSKAQKNFISHLLKRDPKLGDKDIPPPLNSFKRFVKVVHYLRYINLGSREHFGSIVINLEIKKKMVYSFYEISHHSFDKQHRKKLECIKTGQSRP